MRGRGRRAALPPEGAGGGALFRHEFGRLCAVVLRLLAVSLSSRTSCMPLRPAPPGESKQKEVGYLDIHEDDQLDEAQMATWVKQAAALPGWVP